MKNIISKPALLGLVFTAMIPGHAGNAVITNLPQMNDFPEIEQFRHLPYPLNLLSVSRSLSETNRLGTLGDRLSRSQRLAMCNLEQYAALPYPENVLPCIANQIKPRSTPTKIINRILGRRADIDALTELLHADPSLMTTAFNPDKYSQTTIALEVFRENQQDIVYQLLNAGFDPTTRCHLRSYTQRDRQPYILLARSYYPESYDTILRYAKEKQDENREWFAKLHALETFEGVSIAHDLARHEQGYSFGEKKSFFSSVKQFFYFDSYSARPEVNFDDDEEEQSVSTKKLAVLAGVGAVLLYCLLTSTKK